MKSENPFVTEQFIRVVTQSKLKEIMTTEQLLEGDRVVTHPELGSVKINSLLDASNKVSVFMTPEMRVIYMRLSEVSHKLLRYFEGIVQYNNDLVKFNSEKFMGEALIKSRTTVYKGIEELCRYGFITPYHKRSYYWINPFRFFNGNRVTKYPENLKIIN